jgi:L,D-transpeptidase YbiS
MLTVLDGGAPVREYSVSTSSYGPGERVNSWCTPRGSHAVRVKIGADLPVGAVLAGRRFTGEIYDEALGRRYPGRDWILTRILWLTGREPGRNRFGAVDTLKRFIYIHGTPDTEPMGVPVSRGCVRMRNSEMIELFDMVDPGTLIEITP